MPSYNTHEWEQWGLTFKSKGTGIRKFIPIPYFSGSELSINVIVRNNSNEGKDLRFSETLSGADLSSFETLTTYTTESETVSIKPKDKIKRKLQFRSPLPQPGNYSVKLNLKLLCGTQPSQLFDGSSGHGYIVIFDALPRDASITNWGINISMLFLGVLLGWIAGHAG